jgi:hypothetical protein
MAQPTNPFTDEPYTDNPIGYRNIEPNDDLTETTVAVQFHQPNLNSRQGMRFIEWDFLHGNAQDAEYQKIKPLIQGLWENGYPLASGREVISLSMLQEKLASAPIPRTPKEKLDNLLLYIAKQQQEDGAGVELHIQTAYKKIYFSSTVEATFYFRALSENGLIKLNESAYNIFYISLTYKGLSYIADLERSSSASSLCFIAMSFDDSVKHLYTEAIKPACEATGFEAFRVDEYHPDAEQTINDAIIAGIKRSRFCIADFTQHKKGVYFEAGYALGRGLKVIYTCHNDDFKDSHFDTNHYPHIIYSTTDELREKLIAKIEAWVKD